MRPPSLRLLMTLSAALAVPYGLLTIIAPLWWLALIGGHHLPPESALIARMYGGQLVGFGSVSFLARNAPDSPAKRAMIRGFVVVDGLSLLLAIYALAAGHVGPAGWLDVVGFLLLVLAFGYYARYPERDRT